MVNMKKSPQQSEDFFLDESVKECVLYNPFHFISRALTLAAFSAHLSLFFCHTFVCYATGEAVFNFFSDIHELS